MREYDQAIYMADSGITWVGTTSGLYQLSSNNPAKGVISRRYTIWDGLPSNEINDIGKFNEYLIVAVISDYVHLSLKNWTKAI